VRIVIGCDHRGLDLKQAVIPLVAQMGHSYEDIGGYTADPVDYPDIARKVAEKVARGDFDYGILICDTGIGMSIAANKVRGVRAALCCDAFSAGRARQHNDANILCLAARGNLEIVADIIDAFLTTQFEGGRHLRRLNKLEDMEG
jgi:ribose 5-phosphate isomerase B